VFVSGESDTLFDVVKKYLFVHRAGAGTYFVAVCYSFLKAGRNTFIGFVDSCVMTRRSGCCSWCISA